MFKFPKQRVLSRPLALLWLVGGFVLPALASAQVATPGNETPAEQASRAASFVPPHPAVAPHPGNSGVSPVSNGGVINFTYTGAVQNYLVPPGVTFIRIAARGAQGGDVTAQTPFPVGGNGASMAGDFVVVPGSTLSVVVGGKGNNDPSTSGGGGGSGVSAGATPLVVAGGGAGVDFQDPDYAGRHATTANNGLNGNGGDPGLGGVAGADGGDHPYTPTNISRGGRGFNAGSAGSTGANGTSTNTTVTNGTFGLGGGGGSVGYGWCNCGAGGGGYSGGGSGDINQSGGGGGSFNSGANQTNVAGDNTGNGTVTITILSPIANLALTLSDNPDPVTAGTNLTYLATSTNNGPTPADDVTIMLPLPATTTLVSSTPSLGGVCSGVAVGSNGTLTCTWTGATAVSASRSVSVSVLVPASTASGTVLSADASTSSTTGDTDPSNNFAAATTTVATNADLLASLTDSPDPVPAGLEVSYVATLTNGGASNAQDASIALPLPGTTTFVSATPSSGGSCGGVAVGANGTVTCTWAGPTLPAGMRSVTIVAQVPIATPPGTVLNATATVASNTTDGNLGNNYATTTTTVIAGGADLSITLGDSPDPVTAGNNLTYSITLTNGGPADAQDVSIGLPLPAPLTFVSATPSIGGNCTGVAAGANGTVTCTWAGVTAAAGTRNVTIVALVPASTADATVLNATATAATTSTDPTPGNNTSLTTTTVQARADLSITLTDTPDPVNPGANLTYVATLTNGGISDAQAVSVALPMPAGTALVSASADGGGSCSGVAVGANGTVTCIWAGATAPTASRVATIVVAVAPNQAADLSATATASSTTTDPVGGNNTATATTVVQPQADLTITLTDTPDPVNAGSNLTYVATATNGGASDAQAVSVALPMPAGTMLVSASADGGGTCSGVTVGANGTVTCNWASLTAPATSRTATIVVAVAPSQTANLSATATAASTTIDPVPGNNTATATTVVQVQADLSITLTDSPDPVTAGANLTYVATVSNAGPSDANGASVSLTLPAGTSFVSGTVSGGGSCTAAPVCTISGSLAPGATRTVTIVAAVAPSVASGSTLAATATVTATSPDPNSGNNTATATTAVITSANLLLTFSASPAEVRVNEPVTFSASSQNLGPSDAQNVSITVTLTPDFRYSSHLASAGASCTVPQNGTTGVVVCAWAGATAPNATRTLDVVAYSNNAGTIGVSASTTSNTPDPVANNNAGGVSVVIGFVAAPIPTLSPLALLALALALGLFGWVAIRRLS